MTDPYAPVNQPPAPGPSAAQHPVPDASLTQEDGRVLLRKEGAVFCVTLSNPGRRNAITWSMYEQLLKLDECIEKDGDIRLVILRGAGDAFAAGTDVGQFRDFRSGEDGVAYEHRVGAVIDALLTIRVPVVGVVDGPAVGAGLAIASVCDVVIATNDAVFGAPIARTLGNCLPPRIVARLQRQLGPARAMAMLYTARLISAQDAQAAGFVHTITGRGELDAAVEKLVERLLANAPLTLASLKEIDRRLDRAAATVDADDLLELCYGSSDFSEGVNAFLEHRPPQWKGF